MANRNNTFLLKRSNVLDKIPSLSGLTLGELALNTADAKLYTLYTGGFSAATEVREIGWDKLSVSGGTLYGNLLVNGSVSATTFYGDGSYLTNISTTDYYVTGGTFSGTTLILYRQNGEVVITGFTSSGTFTPGSCNTSTSSRVSVAEIHWIVKLICCAILNFIWVCKIIWIHVNSIFFKLFILEDDNIANAL